MIKINSLLVQSNVIIANFKKMSLVFLSDAESIIFNMLYFMPVDGARGSSNFVDGHIKHYGTLRMQCFCLD